MNFGRVFSAVVVPLFLSMGCSAEIAPPAEGEAVGEPSDDGVAEVGESESAQAGCTHVATYIRGNGLNETLAYQVATQNAQAWCNRQGTIGCTGIYKGGCPVQEDGYWSCTVSASTCKPKTFTCVPNGIGEGTVTGRTPCSYAGQSCTTYYVKYTPNAKPPEKRWSTPGTCR